MKVILDDYWKKQRSEILYYNRNYYRKFNLERDIKNPKISLRYCGYDLLSGAFDNYYIGNLPVCDELMHKAKGYYLKSIELSPKRKGEFLPGSYEGLFYTNWWINKRANRNYIEKQALEYEKLIDNKDTWQYRQVGRIWMSIGEIEKAKHWFTLAGTKPSPKKTWENILLFDDLKDEDTCNDLVQKLMYAIESNKRNRNNPKKMLPLKDLLQISLTYKNNIKPKLKLVELLELVRT